MHQLSKQRRNAPFIHPNTVPVRHFRGVLAGIWLGALAIGAHYVYRAHQRVRRQEMGLNVDDEDEMDEQYEKYQSSNRNPTQVLGIDWGTSKLRLASVHTSVGMDKPSKILETAEGAREIAAILAVDSKNISVGLPAMGVLSRKPYGHVATAIRLLLSHSTINSNEMHNFISNLPYQVDMDNRQITLDNQKYSVEWAGQQLIDSAFALAKRSLDDMNTLNPVVLTVPTGISSSERENLTKLAKQASFLSVSYIDEGIAAIYAADRLAREAGTELMPENISNPIIAVFDIGGYQSTLSIIQWRRSEGNLFDPENMDILSSISTTQLSGYTIDTYLVSYVMDRFKQSQGIDLSIDPLATIRVKEAVEKAKCELSSARTTDINLPFITANTSGAKHLLQPLTISDIVRASNIGLQHAKELCYKATEESGLQSPKDIDTLLLVGGGVRSRPVFEAIEKIFDKKAFTTKDFRPEEVVVQGAVEYVRQMR